jgi:eukaryotic-like serine/threonine-protein kinase
VANSDEGPDDVVDAFDVPERDRAFGPYTLLRRLAFGGMGEVYLARRTSSIGGLSRPLVIKRILDHMKRNERLRQTFVEEARLQARLRSPHIVQIHDVGDVDGSVYLAMEHVEGPSWRMLIDRARKLQKHIPLPYVVDMVRQAAEGLAHAHELLDEQTRQPLKIVHRDVNPHNVLVTYDGIVKVIDFGIAKSESRPSNTETGTIKGKFSYMSPEQSAAEPLDARSDLFALGICIYELVSLENPFRRDNVVLSLEAVQRWQPPPIDIKRPGARCLLPILEKLLQKAPADRYASGHDVAAALRALQFGGAIPAAREPIEPWLRGLFARDIELQKNALKDAEAWLPSRPLRVASAHDPTSLPIVIDTSAVTRVAENPLIDERTVESAPAVVRRADTDATSEHTRTSVSQEDFFVQQRQTRRRGLWAAGLAMLVVGAGLVTLLMTRTRTNTLQPPATPVTAVEVVEVAEAVVEVPDVKQPEPTPVVAPPTPTPTPTPVPVVDTTRPKPDAVAATIKVIAGPYTVKGRRTVVDGKATVLTVGGADAPFQAKLRVLMQGSNVTLSVDSEPWAIVRVDDIGKGKTPINVPLTSLKATLKLQNPAVSPMDITVIVTPSAAGD